MDYLYELTVKKEKVSFRPAFGSGSDVGYDMISLYEEISRFHADDWNAGYALFVYEDYMVLIIKKDKVYIVEEALTTVISES